MIARGDVLLTTPVVRALKNKYPHSRIYYETRYPELLERNPCLTAVNKNPTDDHYPTEVKFCNFELRFEQMPNHHLIDFFAHGAGFAPGEVKKTLEMYPTKVHEDWALTMINRDKSIVISPGPGLWTGRNWPESSWAEVCSVLVCRGWHVVLVGTDDNRYNLPCSLDLRGRTNYHQLAAVIKHSRLWVGIDSFPFHVAGAMGTFRIGLFGVTLFNLIACDGPGFAVQSDARHPLTGARHGVRSMVALEQMAKRDNPMRTISVDRVLTAIAETLI